MYLFKEIIFRFPNDPLVDFHFYYRGILKKYGLKILCILRAIFSGKLTYP